MRTETGTIVRTVLLVLALVNQVLSIMGYAVLPIEDGQVEMLITTGATVIIALIGWWKNNSFTKEAKQADEVMKGLKSDSREDKIYQDKVNKL